MRVIDADQIKDLGVLLMTRWYRPDTLDQKLEIVQADPKALLTDELLEKIQTPDWIQPEFASWNPEHRVLTIYGANRTVVYRVTDQWDPRHNAWLMVWPD